MAEVTFGRGQKFWGPTTRTRRHSKTCWTCALSGPQARVPASATDEAGPMPYFLTPDDPELDHPDDWDRPID